MTGSTEGSGRAGRIPDFYIVGHPKSGTTALYEMLRSHPQIYMSELKEPRYFASDLRARFQPIGSERFPETLDQYFDLFRAAQPDQRVGDASPSYLRSRVAAGAIAQARPDARIIAIIREPAGFLRSLHLELVQNRVEDEQDLRRAIAAEALPDAGGAAAPMVRYTDRVRYVEQLRRFGEHFPPEQMLVLIYDDFRADNEATVHRVLRFLGVDESRPVRAVQANPTVRVRSLRLDDAVRALYAGSNPLARTVKAATRTVLPARVREAVLGTARRRLVYAAPHPPDEELMLDLRRRFKPEVQALSEYLGRDLIALWGYDAID